MADSLDRLRAVSEHLVEPEAYTQAVEKLPIALLWAKTDGSVVLFNAEAELLFGYHRSEVLGQPVEMLVPDTLRDQHVRHRSGYAVHPRTRPMGAHLRLQALHKTGREFPVTIHLAPLVTLSGTLIQAAVIGLDHDATAAAAGTV